MMHGFTEPLYQAVSPFLEFDQDNNRLHSKVDPKQLHLIVCYCLIELSHFIEN